MCFFVDFNCNSYIQRLFSQNEFNALSQRSTLAALACKLYRFIPIYFVKVYRGVYSYIYIYKYSTFQLMIKIKEISKIPFVKTFNTSII